MKFILVLLLTVGCLYNKDDEFQPPGGRDKLTKPKNRQSPAQTDINTDTTSQTANKPEIDTTSQTSDSSDNESLIFPIIPSASHTSLLLKSSDYKKISFSAKPETHSLSLVAGLSGTISLKSRNGIYHLSLTPNQGNLILHFELSETGTNVKTSDQAQVSQNQPLLTSNKPITFYITENSEINLLCINTVGLEKVLTVKKDLPNIEECS